MAKEMGKDISQKIRSAIKAKLIELGAYVDDELPDYIMVMVANKKTQEQMTEDLSLFLANNTQKFTDWLHGLLKKLQSVGTAKLESKDKEKAKEVEEKRHSSIPQSAHEEIQKIDKQTEKTSKSKSKEPVKTSSKTIAVSKSDKNPKVTYVKSIKEGKKGTAEEDVLDLLDKGAADEFSEEIKEEETKKVSSGSRDEMPSRSMLSKDKKSETKGEDLNSHQEKVDNGKTIKKIVVKRKKSSGEVTTEEIRTAAKRKSDPETIKVVTTKKHRPASVVTSVTKRKHSVKREESEEEEEYDPYNPAVGSVASVIHVKRSKSDESSLPSKSLLMKAVSDAEKSVSSTLHKVLKEEKMYSEKQSIKSRLGVHPANRGLQTKPNIHPSFIAQDKEMKDKSQVKSPDSKRRTGRESRLASVRPIQVTVAGRMKDKSQLHMVYESRKQNVLSDMKYTIENNVQKKKQPEVARVPPVQDKRKVECNPETSNDVEEEEAQQELLSDNENSEQVITGIVEEDSDDAVSESKESTKEDDENEEDYEGRDLSAETDTEIQQVLATENTDLDTAHDVREGNTRIIKEKPRIPIARVNPKFIVTLDGVDHAKYEKAATHASIDSYSDHGEDVLNLVDEDEEEDIEANFKIEPFDLKVQAAPQKRASIEKLAPTESYDIPTIKPISINLQHDTDDEEMENVEENETPLMKAKKMERCKFWPACVNGNACEYHHPTVSCKMFPICKFGEKCLYIHPNCKYDAVCTRKDCPFTHASKRNNITSVIQKIVPVPMPAMPSYAPSPSTKPLTVCRFYPKCSNLNCTFKHPKPCKYGLACARKSICSFYHPPLPTQDKMKWTSSAVTPGSAKQSSDKAIGDKEHKRQAVMKTS